MAFNWTTFRTRSLSAVLFVAVMLTGLLGNAWTFFALFLVIHAGCWWEYLKLTEKIQQSSLHLYSRLGLILLGTGVVLLFADSGPKSAITKATRITDIRLVLRFRTTEIDLGLAELLSVGLNFCESIKTYLLGPRKIARRRHGLVAK